MEEFHAKEISHRSEHHYVDGKLGYNAQPHRNPAGTRSTYSYDFTGAEAPAFD
jgi:hypothetical protein